MRGYLLAKVLSKVGRFLVEIRCFDEDLGRQRLFRRDGERDCRENGAVLGAEGSEVLEIGLPVFASARWLSIGDIGFFDGLKE